MVKTSQTILIIDDSETNLVLLELVLKVRGWVIQTANSATLAIKMINAGKPDLILLDLLMPGIDGQEMLNRLKSNDKLRHIPVIIVSAVTDSKIRKDCLDKGAVYYMPKPVKIPELIKIIQKTLDKCSAD